MSFSLMEADEEFHNKGTMTISQEMSPGSTLLGRGHVTGPIRRRFVGANTTFLSRLVGGR